jgi:hypothetical protein
LKRATKPIAQHLGFSKEATNYESMRERYKLASVTTMPKRLPTGEFIYPLILADIVSNGDFKHYLARISKPKDSKIVPISNTFMGVLKKQKRLGYMETPETIREWFSNVHLANKEYFDDGA